MSTKKLHTSKTFWWAILSIAVAALARPEMGAIVPLDWMPALQAVIARGNVVLRLVTDKPVNGV